MQPTPDISCSRLLKTTLAEVGEVWGIGRKISARLNTMGVSTALHLADYDRKTLRRMFNVNVERTARELAGEACFALEEGPEPKQMIACTRSFGERKHTLQELQEAVAGYATRAGEKLRGQRHLCQAIQVFIRSSPFDQRGEPYSRATCVALPYPSADTRDLVAASLAGLQAIFRPGPAYAKAGVILMDFVEPGRFTPDLFAPAPRPGSDRLMVSVRPTHLPNLSIKGDGVRVFLSGRDSPYRRDFHAPTKLLP